MINAVLNDLDGLLVNSEELYLEANRVYFKKFNLNFTEKMHREGTGKKFDVWIKTVIDLPKSGEQILKERNLVFFQLARDKLKLLDGTKEYLELINDNYKSALVTSSRQDYLDLVYEVTGLFSAFDYTVTGEMVSNGKPDPECYLLAAQQLNIQPEECCVIEDSPAGIIAAKKAGMKAIAVPSAFVIGHESFKEADIIIETIKDVTPELLNSI